MLELFSGEGQLTSSAAARLGDRISLWISIGSGSTLTPNSTTYIDVVNDISYDIFLRIILRRHVRSDILTNHFLRNSGTYGIDCRSFDILKNPMHDLTEPQGFFIALYQGPSGTAQWSDMGR